MAIVAVIGLATLGVLADSAIKLASEQSRPLGTSWFVLGATGYAATAFGWVFVLRHLKLAEIGHIYCVSTMILLAGSGALWFRETLRGTEIAGLALGVASIVMLRRFG